MNSLWTRSVKEQLPLVIIYLSKDGSITQRKIIVKSLSTAHMLAYCYQRGNVRSFLLNNILAAYPANIMKRKHDTA